MPLSKVENDTNHAIDYSVNCNNQYSCLMQNDKLMMVQNSRGKTDMLKVYSLLDDKAGVQEINLTNKAFYAGTPCIMFYFCNKLALLTGKVHNKILQLSMYQLDTKDAEATCASWKQVPLSRYSISDSLFNLENCIPVSHREDGVIIVSILNDRDNGNHRIVFHVFSQKPSGRKWTATSSLLPIQFSGNVEYQIQSCQIDLESKYIYCSILLHGAGAYIYKFDLMSLKQHQKISNSVSIKPVDNWRITEPALQNCFLSLLQEEIIMISFGNTDDKSIMKVKRPINFLPASPADYQFELPSEIKIVAASIVSASKIVVMYQNNQTKQRFIKTITI